MGFVFLNILFSVSSFADYCLYFCLFSFGHFIGLTFFDSRLLITPLLSSSLCYTIQEIAKTQGVWKFDPVSPLCVQSLQRDGHLIEWDKSKILLVIKMKRKGVLHFKEMAIKKSIKQTLPYITFPDSTCL